MLVAIGSVGFIHTAAPARLVPPSVSVCAAVSSPVSGFVAAACRVRRLGISSAVAPVPRPAAAYTVRHALSSISYRPIQISHPLSSS